VGKCTTKTEVRCIIEDQERPGFHYQIPERWLSDEPPPENKPVSAQESVSLPVASLDRMVQMILTKQLIWRAEDDEPMGEQPRNTSDLGTDTGEEQGPTVSDAILSSPVTSRRETS
jgi:hypothetical protein